MEEGEDEKIVEINEATQWIYENCLGKITRRDLDMQRNKEVNSYDMM